jgi:hypothetical protein
MTSDCITGGRCHGAVDFPDFLTKHQKAVNPESVMMAMIAAEKLAPLCLKSYQVT